MRRNSRGQVLVLFALFLLILIGFAALAIDVGYMYTVRHELQRQPIRVLEGEDLVVEARRRPAEVDRRRGEPVHPIVERRRRDRKDVAAICPEPCRPRATTNGGAAIHAKNVMTVPGVPTPSP